MCTLSTGTVMNTGPSIAYDSRCVAAAARRPSRFATARIRMSVFERLKQPCRAPRTTREIEERRGRLVRTRRHVREPGKFAAPHVANQIDRTDSD